MDRSTETQDRIPLVSVWQALLGHYMTGILLFPVAAAAFWALDRWVFRIDLPLEEHVVSAALGVLITETVRTLVERPFVLKHDHPSPGDWSMTILLLIAPWPSWAGFLWLVHGASAWTWAAAAAASTAYVISTVFLDEPWKWHDNRAEVRRKWEETKDMTRNL